jgi:hypothetical protein
VVQHGDRYYCFQLRRSVGGEGYGMGYAVADHPLGPWHESATATRLIATVPDRVLAPRHACVVRGPDGT